MNRDQLQVKQETSAEEHYILEYLASQAPIDEQFASNLINLALSQRQLHSLLAQNHSAILSSQKPSVRFVLSTMLKQPIFRTQTLKFISSEVTQGCFSLSLNAQMYCLSDLTLLVEACSQHPTLPCGQLILGYLAVKARSYQPSIRKRALMTLMELGQSWQANDKLGQVGNLAAELVLREQLGGEVSYTRGLLPHALQDELHEVRSLALLSLGAFRKHLPSNSFKDIVFHMLNDEHSKVRQAALAMVPDTEGAIDPADLQTLLMGLRQTKTSTRRLVYATVSSLRLVHASLVLIVLDHSLKALQAHRSDKKVIFRMMLGLGKGCPSSVIRDVTEQLRLPAQEPNWKSPSHKATLLLCYDWWKRDKERATCMLPPYFDKHMMFISDVEANLFQRTTTDLATASTRPDSHGTATSQQTLISYLKAELPLSEGFHWEILQYVLSITSAKPMSSHEESTDGLRTLILRYQLGPQELDIVNTALGLGPNASIRQVIVLTEKCLKNRQGWQASGRQLPSNICSVSRVQSDSIVCTNNPLFIDRIVVECYKKNILGQEMSERRWLGVMESTKNAQTVTFYLQLGAYSRIECKMVDGCGVTILDHFEPASI